MVRIINKSWTKTQSLHKKGPKAKAYIAIFYIFRIVSEFLVCLPVLSDFSPLSVRGFPFKFGGNL